MILPRAIAKAQTRASPRSATVSFATESSQQQVRPCPLWRRKRKYIQSIGDSTTGHALMKPRPGKRSPHAHADTALLIRLSLLQPFRQIAFSKTGENDGS